MLSECPELLDAPLGRVPSDQRAVDRTNRDACDPIRLQPGFLQSDDQRVSACAANREWSQPCGRGTGIAPMFSGCVAGLGSIRNQAT